MQRSIKSGLYSMVAGMTLALSGLTGVPGGPGEAQAATLAGLTGEIESITVTDPADKYSGGTMVVAGQIVTIPRNLLIDLPANRLTLQEIYYVDAPAACLAAGKSGLAKGDLCNAYGTGGNASITANRTSGGNLIAGDVFIQKGIESFAGEVTFINYTDGYFRLGGTPGNPDNGVMVRLNDPDGRHTVQQGLGCALGTAQAGQTNNCTPDLRFTLDGDNYTNVFTTGYPMCIPSTLTRTFVDVLDLNTNNNVTETLTTAAQINGTGDLLCPTTNRTVNNGLPVDDSRRFAPIMLGDNVTADGNWEIINGVRFLSAHSTMVSVALTTKNLPDQPDYMFLDEVEVDAPAFNNQRARTLIIGYVTLAAPTADVNIWSLHYDQANQPHELPLASAVGCDIAGGAGTCTAQGLGGVAGNNIFKIRHDVDFNVGAKPRLDPCAHLLADPRMPRVCGNIVSETNIRDMLAILSPIPHEIQARTGHELAFGATLKNLDINGLEATHGQYLFPFGMNLGGISTPEFNEIDLNGLQTPTFFSGIPWNLDRRLGPGGCDGPCGGTPIPLDPFPFEGLDPRTQTNLPLGAYNDSVYTSTTLTDVRNRILSFVAPTGRMAGDATVLAWPPVNPAPFLIANTPLPLVPGAVTPQPPVITSIAPPTGTQGVLYTYQVVASDANVGDVITYSLVAPTPAGMSIVPGTGAISWTPTAGQVGPNVGTVRATDQGGLFAAQSFIVTVAPPAPVAPVITSLPVLTATVGVAYSYPVVATDANVGDIITYSLVAPTPAGMSIVPGTGVISWIPTAGQVGPNAVTVRATDQGGLFAAQSFTVTVAAAPPVPVAPVITSLPVLTATVGVAYSYSVVATDANVGDVITYSLVAPTPAGMAIVPGTGVISWIPAAGQVGLNAVTVRATDQGGLFAAQSFTVTVAAAPPVPVAPVITSLPVTAATVGIAYSYPVVATDANVGDVITYSLVAPTPAGMAIVPGTGVISWIPAAGQVGLNAVTVRATDQGGLFAAQSFTVTVAAAPAGPTITGFTLRSSNTLTAQNRLANPLVTPLTDGLTISLAACGATCRFNMESLIVGTAGTAFNNVRLVLTGATALAVNEGAAPYTMPGDAGVGNYNPMVLNLGAHSLTATPRTNTGATIGTPLTVTFTVVP